MEHAASWYVSAGGWKITCGRRPERDWLEETGLEDSDPEVYSHLVEFRRLVRRWQAAVCCRSTRLLLTLAQDLFDQPAELALSHKLAVLLRRPATRTPPGGCLS